MLTYSLRTSAYLIEQYENAVDYYCAIYLQQLQEMESTLKQRAEDRVTAVLAAKKEEERTKRSEPTDRVTTATALEAIRLVDAYTKRTGKLPKPE